MKIIIIGANETGLHIASQFTDENSEVTVIDEDQKQLSFLKKSLNVGVFWGSGTNLKVLEDANIQQTDLFIACTEHDEKNITSCLLANEYPALKLKIAVTSSENFYDYNLISKYIKSGTNIVINSTQIVAEEVLSNANLSFATEVTSFADKKVLLASYKVKSDSPLVDKKLREIIQPKTGNQFLIACFMRDGQSFIPSGNDVIKENDHVYTLLPRRKIKELNDFFKVKIAQSRRVIIAGDSFLAREIAKGLSKLSFEVTIVCSSEWHELQLGKIFSRKKNIKIVLGDASEIKLQIRLKTSRAAIFIAAYDHDLKNLSIGMVAKYLGAEKTIAIINRQDLVIPAKKVGIDALISPRLSTARQIKKIIRGGELSSDFTTISETEMEVLEMVLKEKSEIIDLPLKEVKLPSGSLVGVLIKGDSKVIIPSGNTKIRLGDKVIMVTKPENVSLLEELIEGEARKTSLKD